jgi:hypothetical protein
MFNNGYLLTSILVGVQSIEEPWLCRFATQILGSPSVNLIDNIYLKVIGYHRLSKNHRFHHVISKYGVMLILHGYTLKF